MLVPTLRVGRGRRTVVEGWEELALRHKPFAILRYFVEHPRRLVTQQELVDAV